MIHFWGSLGDSPRRLTSGPDCVPNSGMTPTDYFTPTSRPAARTYYIVTSSWFASSDDDARGDFDYFIHESESDAYAQAEEWDAAISDRLGDGQQYNVSVVTQEIPSSCLDDADWSWWDICHNDDAVWVTVGEYIPVAY